MGWTAEHDRCCLTRALAAADEHFDPDRNLLAGTATATYHSQLGGRPVHPLRESGAYALMLLDSRDDARLERAQAVLEAVLAHQDQQPDSKTYGIWPYYAEEPLAAMAPPDWNWADFLGEQLYALLARHAARLDRDLRERVESSLGHAAASIRRRDMGPHYTNICALGSFVTLASAELLGDAELHAYALERLRRFHAYTAERGTFNEFNSPTYTVITITALTKLADATRDPEAGRLTAELLARAWRHVTDHWHPPTRQWAGPHSRCYITNLRDNAHVQAVLQKASAGRLAFYADDELPGDHTVATVPFDRFANLADDDLVLAGPRTHREQFEPAGDGREALVGTTWLSPRVALGSANRLDLWNQRRALLAYWGDPEQGSYLQLQALHDGRDFASAQVFCAQEAGVCLALVNFGVDGGDWHPSLDRIKDGRFDARDLRLRLRLANVRPEVLGQQAGDGAWRADLAGTSLAVQPLGGRFGSEPARWETTRLEDGVAVDAVLFNRAAAGLVDWGDIQEAWAAVLIAFDAPLPAVQVSHDADKVTLIAQLPTAGLRVSALRRPARCGEQQAAFRGGLTTV